MKKETGAKLTLALVFASTVVVTAASMTVGVQAACAGLTCVDCSDCGTQCFCNRPSQTCFAN